MKTQTFGEFTDSMLRMCDDSDTRQKIIEIWAQRNHERARSDRIERWIVGAAFALIGACLLLVIFIPVCNALGWIE